MGGASVGNAGLDVDAQPTGTAPPTAGAGARAGACAANGAGAAARHMQMQSKGTTRAHKSLARFFFQRGIYLEIKRVPDLLPAPRRTIIGSWCWRWWSCYYVGYR